jgi:hypothetical protein
MPLRLESKLDVEPLLRRLDETAAALARGDHPAFAAWKGYAGERYLTFIRRRFMENSRGGGEWPDLSPATKMARLRKTQKGKRIAKKVRKMQEFIQGYFPDSDLALRSSMEALGLHFDILRDTGTLFNSLSMGGAGNVFQEDADGITVGTQIGYASYHQEGRGVPQRKILVPPDTETTDAIDRKLSQVAKTMLSGQTGMAAS